VASHHWIRLAPLCPSSSAGRPSCPRRLPRRRPKKRGAEAPPVKGPERYCARANRHLPECGVQSQVLANRRNRRLRMRRLDAERRVRPPRRIRDWIYVVAALCGATPLHVDGSGPAGQLLHINVTKPAEQTGILHVPANSLIGPARQGSRGETWESTCNRVETTPARPKRVHAELAESL